MLKAVSAVPKSGGSFTGPVFNTGQPTLQAYISPTVTNATGDGTAATVVWNNTVVNTGTAMNTSTGVYTAAQTGSYLITANVTITARLATMTSGEIQISTSATGTIRTIYDVPADTGSVTLQMSKIVRLTAGDTFSIIVFLSGGTKTASIFTGSAAGNRYTDLTVWFMG